MHLYRHKQNKQLYSIEHLVLDTKYLNNNAFSGIYAYPYNWQGEIIKHTRDNTLFGQYGNIKVFNPEKFVADNFEIVTEL